MDRSRSIEVALHLKAIVREVNAIAVEDLEELLRIGSSLQATAPLLDPTGYTAGYGDSLHLGQTVLTALLAFKRQVSGTGGFRKVDTPGASRP